MAEVIDYEAGVKGSVKRFSRYEEVVSVAHPLRFKILELLAREPSFPAQIAEKLGVSEQLVYYHMARLKRSGLVRGVETIRRRGTYATRYGLSADGFAVLYRESPVNTAGKPTVSPLFDEIFRGDKPVYMVLSSPEPHGPFRSRGRDHYLAVWLAFLLGSAYGDRTLFEVVLDTRVGPSIGNANLILFGGPAVNVLTASINASLPIYFDASMDNSMISRISGKIYSDDNCGLVELVDNFWGSGRMLVIAGKHLSGTRAATLALVKKPFEVARPNVYGGGLIAHVIEGVDRDSDGEVDDVVMLE